MSAKEKDMSENSNNFEFQAEVSRLLGLVTNALYSNRDIFLRELISNASDACDKLRYLAISDPSLTDQSATTYRIDVSYDTDKRTLHIADNGIGMNRQDLIDNLGTIARSGTTRLMEQIKASKDAEKNGELELIGQFGVGFYASFMVADHVDVITSKAGEAETYRWSSDGLSGFQIEDASDEEKALITNGHGTHIALKLKDDAADYLVPEKVEQIILQYSDHVAMPIYLERDERDQFKPNPVEGAENDNDEQEEKPVNAGSALWTRPKSELTDEDYTKFYQTLTFGMDEPLMNMHWTAEGKIEYTGLLYIPTLRPFDMFDASRRHAVRLYVKRIFITDQCENLVFPWLRFVRGVIDCQDLQLNVSREMLQHNPLINLIRKGVARKVLGELLKLSRKDDVAYATFWGQFGMILKEGLYDAVDQREDLFKLCRFYSTHGEDLVSLEDYIGRMKDGQDKIYYITGESAEALRKSPQIEGYKSRGIEVLLMSDTIDSFWLQNNPEFDGKMFHSVTKGAEDLSKFDEGSKDKDDASDDKKDDKETAEKTSPELEQLMNDMRETLKEEIGNVRISSRLTDSPVCLIAADHGVDMHMENVLKIQQHYTPEVKRVLEINKDHELIQKLAAQLSNDAPSINKDEVAWLLYDQAKILQGEKLEDPSGFAARITKIATLAF